MAFNITLSNTASEQLTEAFLWYEKRGKGNSLLKEVYQLLDTISENPKLFPIDFGEYRRAKVPKYPYIIIYFTATNNVVVTSVFHTKQNPDKRFP